MLSNNYFVWRKKKSDAHFDITGFIDLFFHMYSMNTG